MEETLGELHALDDLSQEKDHKKARVTGSFDTSAIDPMRETNDSKTSDVETNNNSHELLSKEVDGSVKEDSVQLENPIITGKNRKRKKSKLVTSKDVSAREIIEPSTGAVEVPKGNNTPGFFYNTILFLSTGICLELSSCECSILFVLELVMTISRVC
jgi:hypothetical protein